MKLSEYSDIILPAVETELKRQIGRLDNPRIKGFYEILTYHMGWSGVSGNQPSSGKRIRPLLLILVFASCGSNWERAIPAAAGIELVHNFSLIHDDIEDNSAERRGRPTVWKRFGEPMAINVGDAMFAISSLAVSDLSYTFPALQVLRASTILHAACLALTQGQYLDISNQKKTNLEISDYWPMVEGKTSALIAACTEIGAILGGASDKSIEHFRIFGRDLGMAFQVLDDILGIWGDENFTGKSTASDLIEGKNSLPILYGLNRKENFAKRWAASPIQPDEVGEVAELLRNEGAFDYAKAEGERLTTQALTALNSAVTDKRSAEPLIELAMKLLKRNT